MSSQTKTFRIFVSSTFEDLKDERNALQGVFRDLQTLCEHHGCQFQAIDLRWGVSEEASRDQQTMNICLDELERCKEVSPRPNFIILLGDRYGWIPLPPQIEASEFESVRAAAQSPALLDDWYLLDSNAIPSEYVLRPRSRDILEEADYDTWMRIETDIREALHSGIAALGWESRDPRRVKYEYSATHQEILRGALELPDEREHVSAYFRNIENLDELPEDSRYVDDRHDSVKALKREVAVTPGVKVSSYPAHWNGNTLECDVAALASDVYEFLHRVILEEVRALNEADGLTQEDLAHGRFGEERSRHFVGRTDALRDIGEYLSGVSSSPLLVYGPSGIGKSALIAKAVEQAMKGNGAAVVIQRYVGATPNSTEIRSLLENLFLEIARSYGMAEAQTPIDFRELTSRLQDQLALASATRPLIVFLDSLDQLSDTQNSHSLSWLPAKLPPHVRFVVSVLECDGETGRCLQSAKERLPGASFLRLTDLSPMEGAAMLSGWLESEAPNRKRKLTADQHALVMAGFKVCPMPLYLRLAFAEARHWRSFEQPRPLPEDISGIVKQMLERLSGPKEHGPVLTRTFLGLLASARFGLSETEVLDLLTADDRVHRDLRERSARSPEAEGIPMAVWLRLYEDVRPYLMVRLAQGTPLLDFFHREVGETIRGEFASPELHKQVAEFFLHPRPDSSKAAAHRRCAELPYQLTSSGCMWEELEALLTDIDFIEVKGRAGMVHDLVADYARAEDSWPDRGIESRLKSERKRIVEQYAEDLAESAGSLSDAPLPCPPETVPIEAPVEGSEPREWTAFDRVDGFGTIIGQNVWELTAGRVPFFQVAWNSSDSGPVAECLRKLAEMGSSPTSPWLKQLTRPKFARRPSKVLELRVSENAIRTICLTVDGRHAVSGEYCAIRVWDLTTGECVKVLEGHRGYVYSIALTSDGRFALSGAEGKSIRFWNLATGDCLKAIGLDDEVWSVAMTPDGTRALTASGGFVQCWDVQAEHCDWSLFVRDLRSVAMDARGRLGVTAGDGIHIRDLRDGSEIGTLGESKATCVSLTPDGEFVIAGGRDGTVRLWRTRTEECLATLHGPDSGINAVSITPDGSRGVSAGGTVVHIWDLKTGRCIRTLRGHQDVVQSAVISVDGTRVVSGSRDGTFVVWDALSDDVPDQALENSATVIAVSPDNSLAVSGGHRSLTTWSLSDGKPMARLSGHHGRVLCLAIAPDGKRVVSGGEDNRVAIWDIQSGACLHLCKGHRDNVTSVEVTRDGSRVVSRSNDGTVRLWNIETGKTLRELKLPGAVVALTPDGSRIIQAGREMNVWDLTDGACTAIADVPGDIYSVAVTPDGRCAVTGHRDGRVVISDIVGGHFVRTLGECQDTIVAISMSPDGARIVMEGRNHILYVWDLGDGGRRISLAGHGEKVTSMCIALDGSAAVSAPRFRRYYGPEHNTLKVWNLETGSVHLCGLREVLCVAACSQGFVAGLEGEGIEVFSLDNFGTKVPVVTAVRVFRHDVGRWEDHLTVDCSWCGHRFNADPYFSYGESDEASLNSSGINLRSHDIRCPTCSQALRLNAVPCDFRGP